MLSPIPECEACGYKNWPTICAHAAEGIRRKCELVHALGRLDYADGLDRAMCDVPMPEATLGEPVRPCCGQPDPASPGGPILD